MAKCNTISILIDNERTSSSMCQATDVPADTANANVLKWIYYHHTIQAYWQTHISKRCQHHRGEFLCLKTHTWRVQFFTFIGGMKMKPNNMLRARARNGTKVIKAVASPSSWNWHYKVRYNQSLFDATVYC
jgi:hypothetical protein